MSGGHSTSRDEGVPTSLLCKKY